MLLGRRGIKNLTKIGLFLVILVITAIISIYFTSNINNKQSDEGDSKRYKSLHEQRVNNKKNLQNGTDDNCS